MAFFIIPPSTPLKLVSSSTTDVSPPVHPDSPNSDPSLVRQLTGAPHLSCGQSGLCRAHHPGSQSNWFHRFTDQAKETGIGTCPIIGVCLMFFDMSIVYHTSPDTEFKSLAGWLKAQLSQWSQFSCVDGDPLLLTHAGHSFYCSRTHTHVLLATDKTRHSFLHHHAADPWL